MIQSMVPTCAASHAITTANCRTLPFRWLFVRNVSCHCQTLPPPLITKAHNVPRTQESLLPKDCARACLVLCLAMLSACYLYVTFFRGTPSVERPRNDSPEAAP